MEFRDDFFQDEIREDFKIEEMMKRAWAAALEVLEVIDKVCTENNIKWFADYGTLLGAIRHKGFIPWDDDIDISLLRDDYDKLISILPSALPKGFVLAGMYSDVPKFQKAARVKQARVMVDETVYPLASYMERFHGFPYPRIGIDIFPHDKVSMNEEEEKERQDILYRLLVLLTHFDEAFGTKKYREEIDWINATFGANFDYESDCEVDIWRIYDNVCAMFSDTDSNVVDHGICLDAYKDIVRMPFEGYQMAVPVGYDEILTKEYGDYMKPVKYTAVHDYPFYKNQEQEFTRMLRESGITISATEFCRNWQNLKKFAKG